eukprot:11573629-Ditylum_brightwellii.AAC.1
MEELKNDISRCSRKALINFDNNAASCYTWIIPNLANLIGRKKGQTNTFDNNLLTPEEIIKFVQHNDPLWSDIMPVMVSHRPGPSLCIRQSNSTEWT